MIDQWTNKTRNRASKAASIRGKRGEQLVSSVPDGLLIKSRALPDSSSHTKQFPLSEEELIAAAQEGMSFAIEELLSLHRSTVYRAAYHFTGNVQEAEDLVQETMLRAFKNIRKFRKEARFSSWLVAIAINTAISIKRKENRVHWVYLDEPVQLGDELPRAGYLPDHRWNPEREYLNKERRNLVRRAISKQHPKFQVILRWCDLNEISVNQAARRLGITRAAAKSRLFRARRMLLSAVRSRIGESR